MRARYAVYFVPEPGTTLAKWGSALLGRDSESGHAVTQPSFPDFTPEKLSALTADARRYGLHATLKAPFFLKPGRAELDLLRFAEKFVAGRQPIVLPRLVIKRVGSFLALVPCGKTPEGQDALRRINALAADAVSLFDPFRAAPSPWEIARRNPQRLSARQRVLLAEWGYPYVFEEYLFHITLTDKLYNDAESERMEKNLAAHLETVGREAAVISGIGLCRQIIADSADEPGEPSCNSSPEPFTLLKREYFSGYKEKGWG